jgi:ABC-2 type transport system permease protein
MTWRRAVWEVARREIVERSRSGTLRISLVILLVLAVGGAVAAARLDGRTPTDDVGLVGPRSAALSPAIELQARAQDRRARLHALADRAAAARAVRDGDVDVAVIDGDRLLVHRTADTDALRSVQAAVRASRLGERLLAVPPLPTTVLDPRSEEAERDQAMLFAGVLVLFVALATFGSAVAASVTEEKSSRMVEVLLTAISPRRLLAGKILGLGLLGLAEVVVVGGAALAAGELAGGAGLPPAAAGTVALVVLWFVLGFALFSAAYGALGALVSRQEDLDATTGPLTLVLTTAFLLTMFTLEDPDALIVRVASFLPPTAPMVVPSRMVLGDMTWPELALSVGLTAAGTAGLVLVAARVYERALLRTGAPVSLRQLLRRAVAQRAPG